MKNKTMLGAAMVVKDGEMTIEKSITSIIDVVGSFYVVDHGSTDQTKFIVEKLAEKYDNLIYINGFDISYADARNLIIKNAKEKYLLKWDADFIALRRKFGSEVEFTDLLDPALDEMEGEGYNFCMIKAYNLGFNMSQIIKDRPYVGLSGDIRIYKRESSIYKVGKYADEFSIVGEEVKRLYLNKSENDAVILHLDLLKEPVNIALRDLRFAYQRDIVSNNISIDFDDWLSSVEKRTVSELINQKINSRVKSVEITNIFDKLLENDFYREINEKSPYKNIYNDSGDLVGVSWS